MSHNSIMKISALLSLLLIFFISLAFILFKYLRQGQQLTASSTATLSDRNIPFDRNIPITNATLTQLMCGISNEKTNVDTIRKRIVNHTDFRKAKTLKLPQKEIQLENLFNNHAKLSEIVQNPILQASDKSLTASDQLILDLATKHIKTIETTLNIKDLSHLVYGRVTTAAILEKAFLESGLPTNTTIIHDLVNYCNPTGFYCMSVRFLQEIFKKYQEINIGSVNIKNISIESDNKAEPKLLCCITTDVTIFCEGRHEILTCSLRFTPTLSGLQNFSPVRYKHINLTISLPNTMNKYITPLPHHTNTTHINTAMLINKYISTANNTRSILTYQFPNLRMPPLLTVENFCAIITSTATQKAPQFIAPTVTQCHTNILFDTNIPISQEELAELMCGISAKEVDINVIKNRTIPDYTDFRQAKTLKLPRGKIQTEDLFKNHAKLSKIVQNPILQASDKSLTASDQLILDLATKHIETIETTLNIKDLSHLVYERVTTAAILEKAFLESGLPTNTTIIHDLVSYCNLAGFYYMSIRFLQDIFERHQGIDINKESLDIQNIFIEFDKAEPSAETELICRIITSNIVFHEGRHEILTCSLEFIPTSPNSQNFSSTLYKNITLKILLPEAMAKYVTPLPHRTNFTPNNAAILINKNVYTATNEYTLTYRFPDLRISPLLNTQDFCDVASIAIQYKPQFTAPAVCDVASTAIQHTPQFTAPAVTESQEKLLHLVCGISNKESKIDIIENSILTYLSFTLVKTFRISERILLPQHTDYNNCTKLSKILQNPILQASYEPTLTENDKMVLDLAAKHIKTIETTLNIKEGTYPLHHIAVASAIFEGKFLESNLSINKAIIYNLANYCNPKGFYSIPIRCLEEIFKEYPAIHVSRDLYTRFVRLDAEPLTETELICDIFTNVMILHEDRKKTLTECELKFTLTLSDSQNPLSISCENITLRISLPKTIAKHMTRIPHNTNVTLNNALTYRYIHYDDDPDVLICNLPNLPMPPLLTIQNFSPVHNCSDVSINSHSNTTQQHY